MMSIRIDTRFAKAKRYKTKRRVAVRRSVGMRAYDTRLDHALRFSDATRLPRINNISRFKTTMHSGMRMNIVRLTDSFAIDNRVGASKSACVLQRRGAASDLWRTGFKRRYRSKRRKAYMISVWTQMRRITIKRHKTERHVADNRFVGMSCALYAP